MQHQRVDQRVDREVVFALGVAREAATVVEVDGHARVGIGLIGMRAPADRVDARVDFDRVDVLDAAAQRAGDIIAAAGADDHHVLERLAAGIAVEQVRQDIGHAVVLDLEHLLVADVVGGDLAECRRVGDLVVRRPGHLSVDDQAMRADGDEREQGARGGQLHRLAPAREVQHQQHDGDEPDRRRQLEIAHRREGGDAGQAAADVHGVRRNSVGDGVEGAAHDLPQADEGQGNEREERAAHRPHRDDPAARIGRPVFGAEINQPRRRALVADADRYAVRPLPVEQVGDDGRCAGEHRHRQRRGHEIPRPARRQQADAHAEEAGEQHDVGEEGEEHHRRAEPADRRELEEQDQETDEEQLSLRAHDARRCS